MFSSDALGVSETRTIKGPPIHRRETESAWGGERTRSRRRCFAIQKESEKYRSKANKYNIGMYGRRCDKHNERYDMCECFGRVFCWLRVYCHALRYETITAATKLKQSNGHASEQTNVESHSFWSRERGRVGRANRNVCLHRNRFETERYWSISHTVFC